MLWRHDSDYTYELFSIDENPEEFDRFSSLVTLWRSKFVDGKLPKWADFELSDFNEWWGWLVVYDFEGEYRERIRVRLWGTKITDYMGFDLTGKLLELTGDGTIVDSQHFTATDLEFNHAAAETKQIAYLHGPVSIKMKNWRYLYDLGLPLADDGENVDKLLFASFLEEKY